MFDRIAGPYDTMNRVMTAGLDRRWRELAAEATGVGNGASALDACCGTGDLTLALARRVGPRRPGHRPRLLGRDARARAHASRASRAPPRSAGCRATRLALPFAGQPVRRRPRSASALRNLPDPERGLRELARVVRPGGTVVVPRDHAAARPGRWRRSTASGSTASCRRSARCSTTPPTATCRPRCSASRRPRSSARHVLARRPAATSATGCSPSGIVALHMGEVV